MGEDAGMPPNSKAAKTRTTFLCQDCGHTSPKWDGRCPGCGAWGTYVEFSESKRPAVGATAMARRVGGPMLAPLVTVLPLGDQPGGDELRTGLGMPELDRLLGGGIVAGSVMLLAGDPGIGKSTLLLQAAARIANAGGKVLYVSGEESGAQVRMRASRIGAEAPSLLFAGETNVESVVALLESERPKLVIIDSIQTLYLEGTASGAGSVAQVRDTGA